MNKRALILCFGSFITVFSLCYSGSAVAADERNVANDPVLQSQFFDLIHQEISTDFPWIDFEIFEPYQVDQARVNVVEVSVWLGIKAKDASIEVPFPLVKLAHILTRAKSYVRTPQDITESRIKSLASHIASGFGRELVPYLLGKRFYEVLFEVVHETIGARREPFKESVKADELVSRAIKIWNDSFHSKFRVSEVDLEQSPAGNWDVFFSLLDENDIHSELNLELGSDLNVEESIKSLVAQMMKESATAAYFAEDFGVGELRNKNLKDPEKVKHALACERQFTAEYRKLLQ
jgi:hypothetical protein